MDTGKYAWMEDAACAGQASVMFPAQEGNVALARRLCARCPVRRQCHDYALAALSVEDSINRGIWAGKSTEELNDEILATLPLTDEVCAREGCGKFIPESRADKPRKYCSYKCAAAVGRAKQNVRRKSARAA